MRALVVGIDAGCEGVLAPMIAENRLPTLQRLIDRGVSGPLEAHVPPWTPSMWPSLYTGVNPGTHGVFSFLSYDGYDWEIVDATHVREHSIWELLDAHDLRSVVVNVPVTNPSTSFDGALIPGYMAPEDPPCHPRGILDDVRSAIGGYRVYPSSTDDEGEAMERYLEVTGMRGDAFCYLCERFEPDFGFVQFQQTDTVFHEHPGNWDLVEGIYEAVDREVSKILDQCDPQTVFVVSDHGIGEYDGYGFAMNTYLKEQGYVVSTTGGSGMPSWVPVRDNILRRGNDETATHESSWIENAIALAGKGGLTTSRIGTVLDRVGLRRAVADRVPDSIIRSGQEQVDFARSTAYMRARIEMGIRINLAGREPDGVVSPDEYETVRSELIELLSSVETPQGEPVFEDVARREAYFVGPESERAVDIVTVPTAYDHFLTAELLEERFNPPGQPWNHKPVGVYVATGSGIDTSASNGTAKIFDIAPSILAVLGLPASDRMDGDTLPAVETRGERSYPIYENESNTPTGASEIDERLRQLGYLEG